MDTMSIGALAQATGVKVPTIRYYEDVGLLPRPTRTRQGRRIYDEHDLERLQFIRRARDFGFSVAVVRELVHIAERPEQPCDEADIIAGRRLREIEVEISRLCALRDQIREIVDDCRPGLVADCQVVALLTGTG